jgi:hypothetical protein
MAFRRQLWRRSERNEQPAEVVASGSAAQVLNVEVTSDQAAEATSAESESAAEVAAAAETTDVSLEPWLDLVCSTGSEDVEEVARSWRNTGIELDLARVWHSSGVGPDVVRVLMEGEFQPSEAEEWLHTGIPHIEWSKWKKQGFSVSEADRWFGGGCRQAFLARRWLDDSIGAEDASLWIAGGLSSPHDTKLWTRAGWSAKDSWQWLEHGWKSPKAAAPWREAGFDPEEAQRWDAVGVRDADTAALLFVEGAVPDDITTLADTAAPPALIAEWLLAASALPPEVVERRRDWCLARVSPSEAKRWSTVGVDAAEVRAFELASLHLGRVEAWWLRFGISGPTAKRLINAGLSPSELEAWFADGFGEQDIAGWRHLALTPVEVREWSTVGVRDPARCAQWLAMGATVMSVKEWAELGLNEPTHVEVWTSSGIDAAEAGEWLQVGVSAREARRWRQVGEKPASLARWLAVGVDDADVALVLVSQGLDPGVVQSWQARGYSIDETLAWLEAGIVELDQAVDWVDNGFSCTAAGYWGPAEYAPAEARSWLDAGFAGPTDADEWRRAGVSPVAASGWASIGLSPSAASAWSIAGVVDPGIAETWIRCKLTPLQAREWIVQRFTAASRAPWAAIGIGPAAAARWRDHGFVPSDTAPWLGVDVTPDVAAYLKDHGSLHPSAVTAMKSVAVTVEEIVGWVRAGWRGEHLVEIRRALSEPASRAAWRRSGIPLDHWPRWIPVVEGDADLADAWRKENVSPASLREAIQQTGLDPRQLHLWITAGSTGRKMINAYRRGERIPPAPAPVPGVAPSWLTAGREWIASAGMTSRPNHPILRVLHSAGFQWAALTERLFGARPDEDWLPEVLARAEMLRTRIRREPEWPVAFESDNLTIVLFEDGSWIRAWVGTAQRGLLVAFRPSDFEVRYLEGDVDAAYAVGLAVSWFLDCSVSLHGVRAHPHFQPHSSEPSRAVAATRYVYVPRPSFVKAASDVASGTRNPPQAHRVRGHVRELPEGWTPTAEARAQAPAYIRVNLAPNETFVRGHSRGGENGLKEMTMHLSKYSSLADSLGLARR